jgi:hypothetical protein
MLYICNCGKWCYSPQPIMLTQDIELVPFHCGIEMTCVMQDDLLAIVSAPTTTYIGSTLEMPAIPPVDLPTRPKTKPGLGLSPFSLPSRVKEVA